MRLNPSIILSGLLAPFLATGAPIAQNDISSDIPVLQPVEPAGAYIVTLKANIEPSASASHMTWAGDLHRRGLTKRQEEGDDLKTFDLFEFKGYAGVFDEEALAEIEASDDVGAPSTSTTLC
jgi:hypothetical protein